KRVIHSETRSWSIPYCGRCLDHISRLRTAKWVTTALAVLAAIVVVSESSSGNGAAAVIAALVLGGGVTWAWGRLVRRGPAPGVETCATVAEAVAYLGWEGSFHSFEFSSLDYTVRLARANERNLVNVDLALRKVLDAPREWASRPGPRSMPPGLPAPARVDES